MSYILMTKHSHFNTLVQRPKQCLRYVLFYLTGKVSSNLNLNIFQLRTAGQESSTLINTEKQLINLHLYSASYTTKVISRHSPNRAGLNHTL